MHSFDINAWTVIAWVLAAAWVAVVALFAQGIRKRSLLRPLTDRCEPDQLPRLSVIVAAKNEADCIESCIRSLFRQDYPQLQVIAVNDRSTDDTRDILDRLALEFVDRLHVVHVASLPAGWFGKPHALTVGMQSATGSLVCFTDADCVFQATSAIRTAVVELQRRQLQFFSVAARYAMTSLRECVTVPCCSEMLMTWLRPERVEDPRWPDAFANGAFILVQREQFDQIGGWGSVKTTISEDLQLARLAKRAGLRVGIAAADGFYETRSYATTRDSWNGWSRILKGTLTPAQLMITVMRMLILFALPLGAVLTGSLLTLCGQAPRWFTPAAATGFAIAFGLRCVLDVAMFRLVGAPVAAVVLAPLGRLFVMAASMRALFSHAGWVHTHWRGATYSAGRLVMSQSVTPKSPIR